jgi:hypothetical protein
MPVVRGSNFFLAKYSSQRGWRFLSHQPKRGLLFFNIQNWFALTRGYNKFCMIGPKGPVTLLRIVLAYASVWKISLIRRYTLTYALAVLRRISSLRTKLLAARCECLHLIKINGLASWLDEGDHASLAASCEELRARTGNPPLGIRCIRFKHGRVRWHTLAYAEAEIFFKHVQKFCAYRTYALYDKHTLGTRWIR